MSVIQTIFQNHAEDYLAEFGARMPAIHQKAIDAICKCRTGEVGFHCFECPDCGSRELTTSSCGNRHCPACQHNKAIKWVHRQQLRLLPCTYFLGTFTMPEELRAVARANQRVVYAALFDEAAAALRTLEADPRFVGCNIAGFFGVLHTWGRQLQYHPHVHFVIPGGGLSADRGEWIAANGNFLVHVRALSRMFRGKMKAAMKKAGLLPLIPKSTWDHEWVVHCKAVGDGRHIMKYLGNYVFKVAISDARITAYDGKSVTFKYQDGNSSKWRKLTLPVFEFMRRFLQHVLPKGFVKVRHYGFLSPNFNVAIQRIREMICVLYELVRDLTVKIKPPKKPRPLRCPHCQTAMRWRCFIMVPI